jgi:NAD(P) transhydrogenase subunit beta
VSSAIFTSVAYLVGTALFILSLHWMNTPKTARRGVFAGIGGMTLAIVGTMFTPGIENWLYIAIAIVLGFLVGVPLSQVPLTAVPQRTALSHAFGGIAAGLVGTAKYYLWLGEAPSELTPFRMTAIILEILLGYLTSPDRSWRRASCRK